VRRYFFARQTKLCKIEPWSLAQKNSIEYKIAVVGTLGVKTFGPVPTKQILKTKPSTAMAATQILA